MSTETTVDVTPIFNYTQPVAIVKRFLEQVTRMTNEPFADEDAFMDFVNYVRTNLPFVRDAMGEIMADDIKAQIADGTFPIRQPTVWSHPFVPCENEPGVCCNETCYGRRNAMVHTL